LAGNRRKYKVHVPVILLGVPLSRVENGYLAAPTTARLEMVFEQASKGGIILDWNGPPTYSDSMRYARLFLSKLVEELELDSGIYARIALDNPDALNLPEAGIYASLTGILLYAIAREYGETPGVDDIIEMSRMLDQLEYVAGWERVMDALRYSALLGAITVYRNDEEHGEIRRGTVKVTRKIVVESHGQRLDEKLLGPDVYGAVAHLVGTIVLEAAVRIRELENPDGERIYRALEPLLQVSSPILSSFWGVRAEGLIVSPGFPRRFEIVSITR